LKRSQSVLDALADAETLWRIVSALGLRRGYRSEAERCARDLALARRGDVAILHPELAARAAFRAVPALRAAQQEGQ
jgi:hypothetical protein